MDKVYRIILKRRTIRQFQQKKIPFAFLKKLVNSARLAPSGANLQPCAYIVVDDSPLLDKVFTTLKWAGYIAPAGNPPEGKRPVAYIVVWLTRRLANTEKRMPLPPLRIWFWRLGKKELPVAGLARLTEKNYACSWRFHQDIRLILFLLWVILMKGLWPRNLKVQSNTGKTNREFCMCQRKE